MLTLAISGMVVSVLVAVFLFACVVLILVVLIQRPQGGGLSGAFGAGGGAGQTAFGTKTGDALTMATIGMFIVFLGLAIGLNFATRPQNITGGQASLVPAQDAGTAVTEESATDGAGEVEDDAGIEGAEIEGAEIEGAEIEGAEIEGAGTEDDTPAAPPAETPTDEGADDEGEG